MASRAESFFAKLIDEQSLHGLIGQSEDADFDCKEWHGVERSRVSLAKATCGFANAAGGVIIIGMKARSVGGEPDVVQTTAPFRNPRSVTSEVLDTILKLVEPGVEHVETRVILCDDDPLSGYLVVYVPVSDGPPHRSRVDWKFYVRIASGTVPMEYFQIEDRFGRGPHARLIPEIASDEVTPDNKFNPTYFTRRIKIGLRNTGRGLAHYPCLMIPKDAGLEVEYL